MYLTVGHLLGARRPRQAMIPAIGGAPRFSAGPRGRRARTGGRTGTLILAAACALPALSRPATCEPLSRTERRIVAAVDRGVPAALDLLERAVNVNSGTMNLEGVRAVGRLLAPEFEALGFTTEWVDGAAWGRAGHLVARRAGRDGALRILLIGHLDTVFERDSPFQRFERLSGEAARGPGICDMKGGDVVMLLALRALRDAGVLDRLSLVAILTGDEEDSGAPLDAARRRLIEAAEWADVALGFEDGAGDPRTAVIARRGSSGWRLRATGRPAHSSLIFRDDIGSGAIYEAARILAAFRDALAGEAYLTASPGVALGGTSVSFDPEESRGTAFGKTNVVAESAVVAGDLRSISLEQRERAKETMRRIVAAHLPRTSAEIVFEDGYPPLAPSEGNRRLLALYDEASRDLGFGEVTAVDPSRAGAADISFTETLVEMALDGIGLMGDGGHTEKETADLRTLPSQAKRAAVSLLRLATRKPGLAAIPPAAVPIGAPGSEPRGAAPQPAEPRGPVPEVPEDIPADAIFSSLLLGGNKAGDQAVWSTPDGVMHVFHQFNDRGRGPVLRSTYRLGEDGIPVALATKGIDYLKKPVDERFALDGERASWRSTIESGEDRDGAGKFFLGLDSGPEELGILARALLRHGNRLPLLPGGEASIERVREVEVASEGRSMRVALHALSGRDFQPSYLWLDREGGLFASGSAWMMSIRRGWEPAREQLAAAQAAAREERDRNLAERLTRRPEGEVVVRDVSVFDSVTGEVRSHQDVVVRGDRIIRVGDTPAKIARRAMVVDGRGRTLLPGLWDMHTHLSPGDGLLHIAAGVTSVRDLANDIDELAALRRSFDGGLAIGPRVIAAGFIDGPGPYQGPSTVLADTDDQVRRAVRRYAGLGYPQIKIYSSLKPDLVPVVIAEAHRRGLRVSGHIPATMTAEQCIRLGLDEVQHMNMVLLNFMPDVKETRTPARFLAPAERGADLDVSSEPVQAFLRLLNERKVAIDPTLAIFENLFTDRPGEIRSGMRAVADRLPVQVQRGLRAGGLPAPEGMEERHRRSFETMKRLLKEMHDQGVVIVAGTDDLAGFALHRELEIYTEAGLRPADVLRIATRGAAVLMKRDGELGSIAAGRLADLVLVEGDPTRNIGDLRKTVLVMKDGRIFDPVEIEAALGLSPRETLPRESSGSTPSDLR